MRKCCVCHRFLVPCNEGIDHIGFESYAVRKVKYICQDCLTAIQNQVEYGISYRYSEC